MEKHRVLRKTHLKFETQKWNECSRYFHLCVYCTNLEKHDRGKKAAEKMAGKKGRGKKWPMEKKAEGKHGPWKKSRRRK